MDRIDAKLEESLTGIKMGNTKLEEAKWSLEKGLAAKIINFLLISNFIIFILSILRTI